MFSIRQQTIRPPDWYLGRCTVQCLWSFCMKPPKPQVDDFSANELTRHYMDISTGDWYQRHFVDWMNITICRLKIYHWVNCILFHGPWSPNMRSRYRFSEIPTSQVARRKKPVFYLLSPRTKVHLTTVFVGQTWYLRLVWKAPHNMSREWQNSNTNYDGMRRRRISKSERADD